MSYRHELRLTENPDKNESTSPKFRLSSIITKKNSGSVINFIQKSRLLDFGLYGVYCTIGSNNTTKKTYAILTSAITPMQPFITDAFGCAPLIPPSPDVRNTCKYQRP